MAEGAFDLQRINVERRMQKTGEKPRILCSAASPESAADPNAGAADSRFRWLGEAFSRGVTVYLAQKTTVYRQVYRRNAVTLTGFGETTVDGRLAKSRIISTAYSRPETC
jgi:hypothetical protein